MRCESEGLATRIIPNRRLGQVAHYRAGGWVLPRAPPVKKRVANNIAAHHERVKDSVHGSQNMLLRYQSRVNVDLDKAVFVCADCGHQLDSVSQIVREPNVRRCHAL